MSVGFASIIGGYATSETSGIFSDNKQWNPVQVRYCLGHGFTMDGKHDDISGYKSSDDA